MADSGDSNTFGSTYYVIDSIVELNTKMKEALNKVQIQTLTIETFTAPIGIKLNDSNYALWSQVVKMYISYKDKPYVNGNSPRPSSIDPSYHKWCTYNAIIKGWLINSMDSSLIGYFIRFPTAKVVWNSIAITYFDGNDTSQVYDLRRCVTQMRQGIDSPKKNYTE